MPNTLKLKGDPGTLLHMTDVSEVQLYRLEVPLRTPYKLAFGLVRHFDTLVVRVVELARPDRAR